MPDYYPLNESYGLFPEGNEWKACRQSASLQYRPNVPHLARLFASAPLLFRLLCFAG